MDMSEICSGFCIVGRCGIIRRCSPTDPPENGRMTLIAGSRYYDNYLKGAIIAFTCNDGLIPEYNTIRCQLSGQWTRATPRCVSGKEFKFSSQFHFIIYIHQISLPQSKMGLLLIFKPSFRTTMFFVFWF